MTNFKSNKSDKLLRKKIIAENPIETYPPELPEIIGFSTFFCPTFASFRIFVSYM